MSFPYVYIINMRERTERKEKMTKLMQNIGITEYEFIEPVKITDETIPEEYQKNNMNKGNTSLNLTILTKVFPKIREKNRNFIVMEDDIMTMMSERNVHNYILELLKEVPNDWNMIYLEYCLEMCSLGETITKTNKLKKAFKPYCAAAILFRYDTINKVQQCIETKKQPLSFTYTSCIREKDIIAYVAHPPVFAQDVLMQGDIDHTASPFGIHFYLNRILKMYDDTKDTTISKPRLPHCVDSVEIFDYIRWGNVGGILLGFLFLLWGYRYFLITKKRK
jgi:GR25 family glycosyltransferase involved in LPS biosynthesis